MEGVAGSSRDYTDCDSDCECEIIDELQSEPETDESDAGSDLDAAQANQDPLPEDLQEVDSDDEEVEYDYNLQWLPSTSGMKTIPFSKVSKLLISNPGNNAPYDWFALLCDDSLLENICTFTNAYAWEVFQEPNLTPRSRINKWRDMTVGELRVFIGLVLHMGTVRVSRFNDYWSTNRFFNFGLVREQMSRDRWLLILRCIHFSEIRPNAPNDDTQHRLDKVNFIVDNFNNKMSTIYYPGKELAIDASMMLWKGRLVSRQNIKGIWHKSGVKFYSLCEPDGLCISFTIYSGKRGDLGGAGHTNKVVMHLMRQKLGLGHSVYMDNVYTSVPLAAELLRKKTYCTGTLKADRKYLPKDVTSAQLKKGETVVRYAEGIAVAKWRDKRSVLYVSTEFENNMVSSYNRKGHPVEKPLPIIHYNAEMSGIDRHDQLMACYPCEHKTLGWSKKVFFHLLQVSLINSFKLFRKANPSAKKPLYDFRLSVIDVLLPQKCPILKRPRQRNDNVRHVIAKIPKLANKARVDRKRCRQCKKEGHETRTVYFCAQCEGQPGLCALSCFDKWHE